MEIKMETIESDRNYSLVTKEQIKKRFDWVDICRAIAIIFVFLGHWESNHITTFAYAFHLKLFFLISGFFAINCTKKYKAKEYILKKFKTIIIPLFLWAWISIIINNLDCSFSIIDLKTLFGHPASIQGNYWFLPTLFTISIVYYFIKKIIKKDWIILIISYFLLICYGETGILSFNIFKFLESFSITSLIGGYIIYGGIPTYLFWYSLGACTFHWICKIIEFKSEYNYKRMVFHGIGIIFSFITSILFLKNIYVLEIIKTFVSQNGFINNNYIIITSIIIIISIIYISTFLEENDSLKNIGKNTMAHMGLEYITHNYISLSFLPMINLGIANIQTSIHIITIIVLQFFINNILIKYVSSYFPALNGKISNIGKKLVKEKSK